MDLYIKDSIDGYRLNYGAKMRLFAAIDIGDDAKSKISDIMNKLKNTD